MMKLLEGRVEEDDPRDAEIEALHATIRGLKKDVTMAQTEIERARQESARAVSALRRQLTPLYRALQAVFGELDGLTDDLSDNRNDAQARSASPVWDSWKARLGGQCAKVIDALLTHNEMNTTQLGIAIGTRRQNIPSLIYKLNQAGLINKNNGRFSLKELP